MSFEPFQKFIQKAANKSGIGKEFYAIQVCNDFKKIAPEIFKNKKGAVDNIQAAYFKNSELVINVSSPAWAQETIMRKEKIIDEINGKAGKKIIKNLRTQLTQGGKRNIH